MLLGTSAEGIGDNSIDDRGGNRGMGEGNLGGCGGGESGRATRMRWVCRPNCFLTALNNDSALGYVVQSNISSALKLTDRKERSRDTHGIGKRRVRRVDDQGVAHVRAVDPWREIRRTSMHVLQCL